MTQAPESRHTPADTAELLDLYFMEHRAKLIDIAAFLDRLDRASDAGATGGARSEEFRAGAFRRAVEILLEDRPGRAERILDLMSDQTTTPIESPPAIKGAHGAPPKPTP